MNTATEATAAAETEAPEAPAPKPEPDALDLLVARVGDHDANRRNGVCGWYGR